MDGFVRASKSSTREFLKIVCETQLFSCFVDRRKSLDLKKVPLLLLCVVVLAESSQKGDDFERMCHLAVSGGMGGGLLGAIRGFLEDAVDALGDDSDDADDSGTVVLSTPQSRENSRLLSGGISPRENQGSVFFRVNTPPPESADETRSKKSPLSLVFEDEEQESRRPASKPQNLLLSFDDLPVVPNPSPVSLLFNESVDAATSTPLAAAPSSSSLLNFEEVSCPSQNNLLSFE